MDQTLAQAVAADVLLQFLAPCDRNLAALLGEHDGQGIGALGHANGGAMTRANFADADGVRMERQKTGRRGDAVALNNYRPIVQLAAVMKNRAQQIPGYNGI